MPKQTSNSSGGKTVLVIMFLALLGAAGFAAYVRFTPQAAHIPQDLQRNTADTTATVQPTKHDDKPVAPKQDVLRVPGLVGTEVKLDKEAGEVPSDVQPSVFIVNQTLQALQISEAKALHNDIKNRVALIDFNPAIEKGYGTIEEGNLIKAIQLALGQFKEIDSFQIVVEGKPVDSLGNIDLSQPIPVIRPGQESAPTTSEESAKPTPN